MQQRSCGMPRMSVHQMPSPPQPERAHVRIVAIMGTVAVQHPPVPCLGVFNRCHCIVQVCQQQPRKPALQLPGRGSIPPLSAGTGAGAPEQRRRGGVVLVQRMQLLWRRVVSCIGSWRGREVVNTPRWKTKKKKGIFARTPPTWLRIVGEYQGSFRRTPSSHPPPPPAASPSTAVARDTPSGAARSASSCRPCEHPPVRDSRTAACRGDSDSRGRARSGPRVQASTSASSAAHCHLGDRGNGQG